MSEEELRALTMAERKVIERLRVGAVLRSTFVHGYYNVEMPDGSLSRPRAQRKVVARLEQRGYINWRSAGYHLTEAGKKAAAL